MIYLSVHFGFLVRVLRTLTFQTVSFLQVLFVLFCKIRRFRWSSGLPLSLADLGLVCCFRFRKDSSKSGDFDSQRLQFCSNIQQEQISSLQRPERPSPLACVLCSHPCCLWFSSNITCRLSVDLFMCRTSFSFK